MRRSEIEEKTEELLRRHGILEPPIDVETLIYKEGILIANNRYTGNESGFALSQGDTRIIGVNTRTSRNRQRFTMAHELGHLVLHHKPLIVDHSFLFSRRNEISSLGTDQEEIDANAFAAALLMPTGMVREELERQVRKHPTPAREIVIPELAKIFHVSTDAISYRLVNLNLITGWI